MEVPTKHVAAFEAAVPDRTYVKTLKNSVRFKTPQLEEADRKAAAADVRIAAIEGRVFQDLCGLVQAAHAALYAVSRAVAVVDASGSLADVADRDGLVRPHVHAGAHADTQLVVQDGRHLVVERGLSEGWAALPAGNDAGPAWLATPGPRSFVPNNVVMGVPGDPQRLWVVLGPNMGACGGCRLLAVGWCCETRSRTLSPPGCPLGGKSTFLRQTAHIVVLAQSGAFVPASHVTLSVTDQLFSRVGASDGASCGCTSPSRTALNSPVCGAAQIWRATSPRSWWRCRKLLTFCGKPPRSRW